MRLFQQRGRAKLLAIFKIDDARSNRAADQLHMMFIMTRIQDCCKLEERKLISQPATFICTFDLNSFICKSSAVLCKN